MKIRILSDLHIEHNMPEEVPACGADLTILAGDIANGRDGIDWAARVFDGPCSTCRAITSTTRAPSMR
jgi:3',5'-cyclic AMP phosphodiesterase CpdA